MMKYINYLIYVVALIFLISCNSGKNGNDLTNTNLAKVAKTATNSSINRTNKQLLAVISTNKGLIYTGGVNTLSTDGFIDSSNNYVTSTSGYSGPNAILGIAHSENGNMVAVGLNGDIIFKEDESPKWTKIHRYTSCNYEDGICNLSGVTAYGNMFVAVGDFGGITFSVDAGKTWRNVSTNTDKGLKAVAVDSYTGNFVAVGLNGVVFTSQGGYFWTQREVVVNGAQPVNFRGIAVNKYGTWIAVGEDGIYSSIDNGVTWKMKFNPINKNRTLYSIASDGINFITVGEETIIENGFEYKVGILIYSNDNGNTWQRTKLDNLIHQQYYGVAYSEFRKEFIVVGVDNGLIYTDPAMIISRDVGKTWQYYNDLNHFVNFSIDGRRARGIDSLSNTLVVSLPKNTNISEIAPSFTYDGAYVTVNGKIQYSGISKPSIEPNKPVSYVVHSEETSKLSTTYKVLVDNKDIDGYAYVAIAKLDIPGSNYIQISRCEIIAQTGDVENCTVDYTIHPQNQNLLVPNANAKIQMTISNNKYLYIDFYSDASQVRPEKTLYKCNIDTYDGTLSQCKQLSVQNYSDTMLSIMPVLINAVDDKLYRIIDSVKAASTMQICDINRDDGNLTNCYDHYFKQDSGYMLLNSLGFDPSGRYMISMNGYITDRHFEKCQLPLLPNSLSSPYSCFAMFGYRSFIDYVLSPLVIVSKIDEEYMFFSSLYGSYSQQANQTLNVCKGDICGENALSKGRINDFFHGVNNDYIYSSKEKSIEICKVDKQHISVFEFCKDYIPSTMMDEGKIISLKTLSFSSD